MTGRRFRVLLIASLMIASASVGESYCSIGTMYAQTQKKSGTARNAKRNNNSRAKASSNSKTSKGKAAQKAQQKSVTSADMRRKEQQTQREIAETQARIAENEKKVKTGLAELGRIDADMAVTSAQVAELSGRVNDLDTRISTLTKKIDDGRTELERLREQYLKAVKQMWLRRGNTSALAFIFSSESFNQAMRRLRYLKQFSAWRTRQNELITAKIKDLSFQTQLLAQSKSEQEEALQKQQVAQQTLATQRTRQDALVTELKRNGRALESHLAKKQAEANSLKNQISALIAQEQRKAEEERRRKEELARAEAAKKAEAARLAEEKKAAEAAKAREAAEKKKAEAAKPAEKPKKEDKKQTAQEKDKDYAGARKRTPRNSTPATGAPTPQKPPTTPAKPAPQPAASQSGGFASAKGSLPYPVSGQFKVTSRFGRHPLPSLPNVEYDNPGIDAVTSAGNSARAVYGGKVSGVYVLPGYSTVVIINHGAYYTVYGNIASPSVKVGEEVKQGQVLGKLAADEDNPGSSSIHFEVWHNRDKLDPMQWLK